MSPLGQRGANSRATAHENDQKIMEFLIEYVGLRGYAPSNAEIVEGTGMSVSTVHRRLRALAKEGMIELGSGSRAIIVK